MTTHKQTLPNYPQQRLKRLRACMRTHNLDAMLSLDPINLRWLSGWQEVFDAEPAHLALITAKKAYIHTDSRYVDTMQDKNKQDHWQISAKPMRHFAFAQTILARSRKQGLRVGYESSIRLDLYKSLKKALAPSAVKLVETKDLFENLRAIKDDEEIKLLRKAQAITDAAFSDLLSWVAPGMRELEIANRLDFALRDRGGEGIAFQTIAASGPHSALPHACPTSRRVRSGDFLTLDFGARSKDYCADMTRTLVIGEATDKQRVIYAAVLAAQTTAKSGLRAGITGKQAHELAVEALKAEGLEKAFTHSLGHGVGIAVHEKPALAPSNTNPLVAGNVVTVEPGVYLPGYGGVRIEDFGLIKATGFSCFTRSSHELIEIREK